MTKENFENMETMDIPYEQIKNAKSINKAKTNPQTLNQLATEIATKLKTSPGIAKALIFGNLHSGGTASKAAPTHTFTLNFNGKDYFLDLQNLRIASEKVATIQGEKFTLRQLARTHEQEIIAFASKLNIPGNLSKKLLQMDPTLETNLLIYAADYVDPTNPSIPSEIQTLLMEHKRTTIK